MVDHGLGLPGRANGKTISLYVPFARALIFAWPIALALALKGGGKDSFQKPIDSRFYRTEAR